MTPAWAFCVFPHYVTRIPTERLQLLRAADQLECPSCRQPVRRIQHGEGSLLLTCANKLEPRGEQRFGDVCGQHIYVATGAEGYSNLLAISDDEFGILSANRMVPPPADALRILGVLASRAPDVIPTHPCTKCHTATSLSDLFGGQCRRCAGVVRIA